MWRAMSVSSTAKRFLQRNRLEKGYLYGFYCRGRGLSGGSYDYREKIRGGFLQDVKLDDAIGLFGEMVKSRPFPSIIEFSKLLSAIAKMKKHDVVISLGEQMQKLGIAKGRGNVGGSADECGW
uniref:Pentatricopeptide repeat-containing protein, mitochondrial n=1 Tax=Noccaea caerulescens TaxID=107243 RepID=A0A1J3K5B7_NOCCA